MSFLIEAKKVEVRSKSGSSIIQDVSFCIGKGEFVLLCGKTGSGKSTLLKSMYGELPIFCGELKVCDFDLKKLNQSRVHLLRRKLGIIFQEFHLLYDRSVSENLDFVLEAMGWRCLESRKKRISEILSLLAISWAEEKMPYQLSGGEQQKVCIARALLNDPLVILADEPTGHLDSKVAEEVFSLFLEINKGGTTILMATHNESFLERGMRRLSCSNGFFV